MKFACDACHAQYMIADEKVRDRAVKVKCKKCDHVIVVRPPKPSADAPAFEEREGTLDERMGDRHPGLEHAEHMGLGGATEESGQLPSMDDDSNEIDSDETHILDEDEARSAAASFGTAANVADDIPDAPPAAAADATHVALNPLAGMQSEDFNGPSDGAGDDDVPESAFAPPTDLIATTQGEALGASGEGPIGADENISTVVSAPNVFDDSNALAGDLALGADLDLNGELDDDDEALSPFGSDDAVDESADPAAGIPSDGPLALDGSDDDDGGDNGVPEPPSGDEVEAALSGEGAPVEEPPPFDEPSDGEAAFGMPDVHSFDDETGNGQNLEDPTVAGPAADAPLDEPKDELDEQLAGAFNQMFSEPGAMPFPEADDDDGIGHHDPTSVIAPEEMDALRGKAAASSQLFRDDESFDDMATMNASDEADEPEWHVAIDDEDVGPLSLAEVRDEVTSGRLLRDSLVWKVGMDDWYPAEDVPEIADLFVPAPRSLDPGAAAGLAGFDVGEPVDDMGPSPFGGPENSDPFGQVQDLHDDPDPSWQPHGLTDVYQAANLAEAGGAAPPPPAMDLPADDESEGGWRPGAASALSALVANEIERIESSPEESNASPLLPADDGPSQDGPAEASGPALLEGIAGPELSGGIAAAPFNADLGPELDAGPPLAPYAGVPQTGAQQIYPAAVPPPAEQGRSNLLLALIGLLGLVIVMVGVVAVVAVIKMTGPSTQVATGQPGAGTSASANPTAAGQPSTPDTQDAAAAAKGDDAKKNAEAEKAAEEKGADEAKKEEPTKVAMVEKKDPPKEVEEKEAAKPAPKPVAVKKEAKETSSRSGRRSRSRASRATPKPEPKPAPKPEPRRASSSSSKDCDPVLDFDCDEKTTRPKKKRTLSKSDILSTVKRKIGTINACGRKHNVKGSVKMRWQISKSGSTKGVKTLTSKYKGQPVASCLEAAIRRWKFPSYTGKAPGNIDFPFKLK